MDDTNPFQSPTASLETPTRGRGDFPQVDGDCLVVTSGTVLSPVCIITNRPVTEYDLSRKQFTWCTPWVGLLILVNPLVLLLVYLVLRRKCWLTYGLDQRVRRKYRRRILLKVLAVFALLFAVIVAAGWDAVEAMAIALILFLVALVSLCFGNSPLRVVKYRKGVFWMKGASEEYLASLRVAGPLPQ